jgi:hypothetical protein
MKHKKHDKIVEEYKNKKTKVLTRKADALLKQDEKNQKLKSYSMNNPFNLFADDSAEDKG